MKIMQAKLYNLRRIWGMMSSLVYTCVYLKEMFALYSLEDFAPKRSRGVESLRDDSGGCF